MWLVKAGEICVILGKFENPVVTECATGFSGN